MIIGRGGHAKDIADDLDETHTLVQSHVPLLGAYIGVNDPAVRQRLDTHEPDFDGTWIHSTATLGPDVFTGRHVHINANTFLTRCTIGDYTTVSPGATICGDVTIGWRCQIGAGATVSHFVTLDDDVILGAGCVVPPHRQLESGTYVGVPARRIR